jgi:hypothetical protein
MYLCSRRCEKLVFLGIRKAHERRTSRDSATDRTEDHAQVECRLVGADTLGGDHGLFREVPRSRT